MGKKHFWEEEGGELGSLEQGSILDQLTYTEPLDLRKEAKTVLAVVQQDRPDAELCVVGWWDGLDYFETWRIEVPARAMAPGPFENRRGIEVWRT